MKKTFLALLGATTLAFGGLALAHEHEGEATMNQLKSAKVDMAQAISKAESTFGGKVSEAKFENEDGKSFYEVELVTDKKMFDLKIDAYSGKVIRQQEDHED